MSFTPSKKWNQYVNEKAHEFKPDTEELIKIAFKLRKKYHLLVKREWFIVYNAYQIKFLEFTEFITRNHLNRGYKWRCPDLGIIRPGFTKPFIIEIDGNIHNIRIQETDERNKIYEALKIPYLVFPSGIGFDYITKQLAEAKVI